jgi:hypothetical protein
LRHRDNPTPSKSSPSISQKVAVFTVTLDDRNAVQGHLLRYYATLMSQNEIASFVESSLFLLYTAEEQIPPTFGWRDTQKELE